MHSAKQKWGYVESRYWKFKQWSLVRTVSGWLLCGQSDRRIVSGWIYSKPVGWLVVLSAAIGRLVGEMVGAWLACRLVCLLSGLSVGRSNHPAGLLSNLSLTDRPCIHPFIWSLTNRPKTVLLQVISVCISGIGTGVWRIPISSGRLAAVGLPGPCLQVAGQIRGVFH